MVKEMSAANVSPVSAVGLVEVRLRVSRAAQQVVAKLTELRARYLVRRVSFLGPGVPTASITQLKPVTRLPHHKDVTKGIAMRAVEIIHWYGIDNAVYFPGVGLGPLEAESNLLKLGAKVNKPTLVLRMKLNSFF